MGCKESEPKKNNLKGSQISSGSNLKANPVIRKWEKKEKYDLSKIVVNQQYQETFLENEPIRLRKLKPNYYNLNDGKISIMDTIGEEPETNDPNRKRPNRLKTKIELANNLGNSSIELENSNGKVLIVVPLEDGKRWIKEYDKDIQINQIVEDFKNEKKMELPNNINLDWKCNNNPLDLDAKIETLISKVHPTVFLNLDIEQKSLELINENEEDENNFDLNDVAKPFKSPFEVYAFSKRNKGFQILNFDRNEIKNSNIEKYNLTSAYCNGNNHLFISGGENSMNINKFWEINLQTNSIDAYDLPTMKRNHSMIFVPNKYVFIVGGNDKIVYYFDCETKKIAKWAELNENHIEPSLILYKNKDLYVFSNGDDEIVFEKSDLSSGKPKFEKIEPRLEADLNEFGQKFFGVCLKDENTFIFLGGEMNNENEFNYEYDIDENLIKKSDLKFKRFNLREKTFMKYNKKIDFLLTDFNRGRPEILVYKNNRNYFNSIFFSADNLKRSSLNNETQKKNKKYNFDMPDFSNYENNKFNFDFNNNVNNNLKEENENNFQSAEKNFNNNNNIKSIFNYDGEIPNASTKFTNEAIRSNQKDGFDSNNSNNIPDNHNKKNSNQEIINEGPEIDSNVRNFDDDNNNNSNRNLNNINNDNNNNDDDNNNDDNNNVMIVNNEDDNDNNDDNNNRMNENEDDNNNNNNSNNDDNNNKMIENEDDNNNNNNSNNDDNNFDGNLARSSIIINNSKGNEKKSELPLANKTRNKIRSTFLGNSGILDRNDIEENLGKSFNAGIGGKKI